MMLQILTIFQLAIGKKLQPLISYIFVYKNLSIIKLAGPIAYICGATWSQELAGLIPGRGLQGPGGTTMFCILIAVGKGYEVFWNTLVFYVKQMTPSPCFKAFENISIDTVLTATQSTQLFLLLQPLHCILISSARWIHVSPEGW